MSQQAQPSVSTEFVALMGLLTSLVALSIDAMMPALPAIGRELGTRDPNDAQLVLSAVFAGLAVGQLFYGPISDSVGRKPAIYVGLGIFSAGSIVSIFATSFEAMIFGRVLQGLGAAGPRVVVIALVRDLYGGRAMARTMSFVMMLFICVPALAPAIGQTIQLYFGWRAIFGSFLAIALIGFCWFGVRQEETCKPENRVPFTFTVILSGVIGTLKTPTSLRYTITAGFVFGAFIGFLVSVQQIFQVTYDTGDLFPLYFGILALAIGIASVVNGKIVMRFGMRVISFRAVVFTSMLSGLFWFCLLAGFTAPFWTFMSYMFMTFFCFGLLLPNFQALAMEPLGHIAGVGAAVVSSLTTFISLILGTLIGQFYDGSILPVVAGTAGLAFLSVLTMLWANRPSAG